MGILNIGTQALNADQFALQTIGNNIANVNTPGYSRENVILSTAPEQYTGAGYVGDGVNVTTVAREFNAFLNQQATQTSSVAAGDQTLSTQMLSLQNLFVGGTNDVGQTISNMLNSFAGIAAAPTDMTARSVALANAGEAVTSMQQMASSLQTLQDSVTQPLAQMVTNVNSLAQNIAQVNSEIQAAQGSGQPPNQLLDQRDNLITQLNQLVQTTQIPASDGTVGVFIGGSQALVLGTTVSPISLVNQDAFGDPTKSSISINQAGTAVPVSQSSLGGGQIAGMLQFQNVDLDTATNLVGQMVLATTTAVNNQQALGLDMAGNPGTPLFTASGSTTNPPTVGTVLPALTNQPNTGAALNLTVSDPTQFQPSDYEVTYTTATTGTITRLSDGTVTDFPQTPAATAPAIATVDGININLASGAPAAGDSFMVRPFNTAAADVKVAFSTPQSLAMASPVAATLAATNSGSLTVTSLSPLGNATPIDNYTITFTAVPATGTTPASDTYQVVDQTTNTPVTNGTYVPGQAISYTQPGGPGWSLTLTGTPADQDTVSVGRNAYASTDGSNATAMANLGATPMFNNAALTDGYAAIIAQVGILAQSANYSAQVSSTLSTNAANANTSVSGVNLDEEASNLLQYQQAYQAASRMIQVSQSIFTDLMQALQ